MAPVSLASINLISCGMDTRKWNECHALWSVIVKALAVGKHEWVQYYLWVVLYNTIYLKTKKYIETSYCRCNLDDRAKVHDKEHHQEMNIIKKQLANQPMWHSVDLYCESVMNKEMHWCKWTMYNYLLYVVHGCMHYTIIDCDLLDCAGNVTLLIKWHIPSGLSNIKSTLCCELMYL